MTYEYLYDPAGDDVQNGEDQNTCCCSCGEDDAQESHHVASEEEEKETQDASAPRESQCHELERQLMYLKADFDNFRRNTAKEKAALRHNAQAEVIGDLLSIVDDFDRAIADLRGQDTLTDNERSRLQGLEMIYKSLYELLDRYKVTPIATDVPFDPSHHEALVQVASQEHESGAIVEVIQKGYMMDGKVLRPAKVSVAE